MGRRVCWLYPLILTALACCPVSTLAEAPKGPKAQAKDKPAAAKPGGKTAAKEATKPATAPAKAKEMPKDKAKLKEAAKKSEAAEASEKPTPYRVKKKPFRIEVSLDGVVEARNTSEVSLHPQEWASLVVLKAVEHGTAVKRGDLLVSLETEKIDRAISDLQSELRLGELALKQAEEHLAAVEKAAPLDMEAGQRAKRMADEDWKQFVDVEKPLSVKYADFSLQTAKDAVEYQQEELRQLEKMYKADDLVEDTEAIVLKRARDAVKRAKFNLEISQALRDEAQKLAIPRREERNKETTARSAIEWDSTKAVLPLLVSKRRLELEKLKVQRGQEQERLNKFLADRAAMTVKAPSDGIVFYGRSVRGKWPTASSAAQQLRRGGNIMPHDVFMTIVEPRPITVRAVLPEAQLQHVRAGLPAIVEPAGFSDLKLPAISEAVSSMITEAGGYEARFTLAGDAASGQLMPGMTCDVKLMPYKKADALVIPTKALFTEELDPLKQYVYLLGKGDKPEKRAVKPGKRNEKQVEIVEGLAEGDQILQEKPKDE
jgi:HlyD family secretion protein